MIVGVSGVWLRRIGLYLEVLVERNGQWCLVIQERYDSNISHIVEASGIADAPRDVLTTPAVAAGILGPGMPEYDALIRERTPPYGE